MDTSCYNRRCSLRGGREVCDAWLGAVPDAVMACIFACLSASRHFRFGRTSRRMARISRLSAASPRAIYCSNRLLKSAPPASFCRLRPWRIFSTSSPGFEESHSSHWISTICTMSSLRELEISLARGHVADLSPLCSLPHLEILRLHRGHARSLDALLGLTRLCTLDVCYIRLHDVTTLPPNLTSLAIRNLHDYDIDEFTDDVDASAVPINPYLRAILKLPLRELHLCVGTYFRLPGRHLHAIAASLPKLEVLACEKVGALSSSPLPQFHSLTSLRFSVDAPEQMRAIALACPVLKRLDPCGLSWLPGSCALALSTFSTLTELRIRFIDQTRMNQFCSNTLAPLRVLTVMHGDFHDLTAISHLTSLDTVTLHGCDNLKHVDPLSKLPSLTKLDMARSWESAHPPSRQPDLLISAQPSNPSELGFLSLRFLRLDRIESPLVRVPIALRDGALRELEIISDRVPTNLVTQLSNISSLTRFSFAGCTLSPERRAALFAIPTLRIVNLPE
jgi:hypothetical protein